MRLMQYNSLVQIISENQLIFKDLEAHILKSVDGRLFVSGTFECKSWYFSGEFEVEYNKKMKSMGVYPYSNYLFYPIYLKDFDIDNVDGTLFLMPSGAYKFTKNVS